MINKLVRFIGIGGVSRSGKSYLSRQLTDRARLSGRSAIVLDQDDFVYPEEQIPLIRGHLDWEHPDSIDFEKFYKAIISAGNHYSLVVTEGLMVFSDPDIFSLFDYRIFIGLPKGEFFQRKKLDLRWGKEPDWYIEHIWNGYERYGQFPEPHQPDILLDGTHPFNIDELYQKIFPNPL